MKKKVMIIAALIAVAAIFTAGALNGVSQAKKDSYNIDMILKSNSSEYWNLVQEGAKACAKDYGVELDIKGPATEEDILDQVSLLQSDIESNSYDAYIISPCSDLIDKVVDEANGCFVAMDTEISSDNVASFVGTDNYSAAKDAAVLAVSMAKARGWKEIDAVCISGVPDDKTSDARRDGYYDGTTENNGKVFNEEYYTNGKGESAANAMIKIMKKHKDGVAIVYCNNDEMAIEAAKLAGTNKKFENTVFVGFDGIHSGCIAINDNLIQLSVGQDAYEIGYKSVEEAIFALKGEPLEPVIKTGYKIIDSTNANERISELQ